MQVVPDKSFLDVSDPTLTGSKRYIHGVNEFLTYAYSNPQRLSSSKIHCPCKRCKNNEIHHKAVVRVHLIAQGFDPNYRIWSFHGEGGAPDEMAHAEMEEINVHEDQPVDDIDTMLEDIRVAPSTRDNRLEDDPFFDEVNCLNKLVEDNEKDLYEGCTEFTRLSFLIRLLHIQNLSGMTVTHFEMLLDLLRRVIPGGKETIPMTHYEASKVIDTLGLDYRKIRCMP